MANDELNRRDAVKVMAAGGAALAAGYAGEGGATMTGTSAKTILYTRPLPSTGPWPTLDPFLFCVHHHDAYPKGNGRFGPAVSLAGRRIGQDFSNRDGWSMYHGETVPGFPRHPHRGFETVTVVRQGLVDHADSMGAAARYGEGDAQWLTAGNGINHSEMMPLLRPDEDNPLDLFQLWLNLPRADKRVKPYFSMFWNESIPRYAPSGSDGDGVEVTVVAGALPGVTPLSPPPNSYASRSTSAVAIWSIRMAPGGHWRIPAANPGVNRAIYIVSGRGVSVDGEAIPTRHQAVVRGDAVAHLKAESDADILVLQGRPIGEPVVQHGPMVMNTREEIMQAFQDYRRTQFGGWPWPSAGPVHGGEARRFAKHADGRYESPHA